jgi:hypothetical protein
VNNTRFTWTAEEIREFGHQVVELIADHLTTLPERPVFRPVPRERDELNKRVLAAIQMSGQAFVTGTSVRGQFALRACVVNPRSTDARY